MKQFQANVLFFIVAFLLGILVGVNALSDSTNMKAGTSEEIQVQMWNSTTGRWITDATCRIFVYFPNKTLSFNNPMNFTNMGGTYNYTWPAPATPIGKWHLDVNCTSSQENRSGGRDFNLVAILDSEKLNQTLNNTNSIIFTLAYLNSTSIPLLRQINSTTIYINQTFFPYLSQINTTTLTTFIISNGNFTQIQTNFSTVFSNLSTIRTNLGILTNTVNENFTYIRLNLTDLDLDLNSLVDTINGNLTYIRLNLTDIDNDLSALSIASFENFTIFRDNLTIILGNISTIINNSNDILGNLSIINSTITSIQSDILYWTGIFQGNLTDMNYNLSQILNETYFIPSRTLSDFTFLVNTVPTGGGGGASYVRSTVTPFSSLITAPGTSKQDYSWVMVGLALLIVVMIVYAGIRNPTFRRQIRNLTKWEE